MTADMVNRILSNTDVPFTVGHNRWLAEGAVITKPAFATIMQLMVKDFFETDRSDGSGRLRASNFGTMDMAGIEPCDRMHILSFLGVDKDPHDLGSMELMSTGTFLHYYYQLGGLSAGYLAEVEAPVSHDRWNLRGSMDGIFTDGSGLEIKTTGYKTIKPVMDAYTDFAKNSPGESWRAAKRSHLWQVHLYMEATGIRKFSIVYIDRGYPTRFLEIPVPYQQEVIDDVEATMSRLVGYVDTKTLPPMLDGCQMMRGTTYDRCDYRSMCPHVKEFS